MLSKIENNTLRLCRPRIKYTYVVYLGMSHTCSLCQHNKHCRLHPVVCYNLQYLDFSRTSPSLRKPIALTPCITVKENKHWL